jgi:hypothetical protein
MYGSVTWTTVRDAVKFEDGSRPLTY